MSGNRLLLSFGNIQEKESAYLSEVSSLEGLSRLLQPELITQNKNIYIFFVRIE
jgi:hypothetical protein